MTVEQQDINARAMERYRRGITIELTSDNALHVTLNGLHSVNNIDEFASALYNITVRSRLARQIIPSPPTGVSYREFLNMAIGLNSNGSKKSQ